MSKKIILIMLILPFALFAQENITIMQYNLTYYGNTASFVNCTNSNNSVSNKNSYLKTIIDEIQPDIFGVNELGYSVTYANSLRDNALNVSGRDYYAKTQLNGFGDIANLLYYNKDKFGLYFEDDIDKDLSGNWITRAIDVHTLYYKAPDLAETKDTIYLTFIIAHLKAGSDADDAQRRSDATLAMMNYLENNTVKGYKFFMGDFNIKTSSEVAFQNIINYSNQDYNFVDPINQLGSWSSNSTFASIHTQSTRSSDNNGGCFITGGLDDRYDLIMMDKTMLNSNSKVKYVENSYKALGNDGSSYNGALKISNNSVVSEELAQALYNMSDHLPVVMDIEISGLVSTEKLVNKIEIRSSNPMNESLVVTTKGSENYVLTLMDISGKILIQSKLKSKIQLNVSDLERGIYLLKISNQDGDFITKKLLK